MHSDAEHIVKNWEWWSNFLQREYYAASSEQIGWDAAALDVATTVNLKPGMRVLDLGSGSGEMIFRLALRGADVTGVEQSASLVDYCIREAASRGVIASFVASNMFDYEPDEPFDVILSLNTSFGYGTDEQNRELIAGIGRWLVPGGAFYFDVCTADHAQEFGQWTDQLAGGTLIVDNTYLRDERTMISHPAWISPDYSTVYVADEPERIILYTRQDLEAMMRQAGMEPSRLDHGSGRAARQGDSDMLTTWLAIRGDGRTIRR